MDGQGEARGCTGHVFSVYTRKLTTFISVYTINSMKVEFDPAKDQRNTEKHRVSLALAGQFELDTAVIRMDWRKDYGELRFNAIGYVGQRLYHMTFTLRGEAIRVISLRKANRREIQRYAET